MPVVEGMFKSLARPGGNVTGVAVAVMEYRPAHLSGRRLGGLSQPVHDHNLFMITGPGSPLVLASMIQAIEQHVDWMVDLIAHMRDIGARTVEPKIEDEDRWVEHVNEVSKVSLRSTCSSWYVGANVPGRPRVFMPYIGGFPVYVQKCNEVMDGGYGGFVLEGALGARAAGNAPPEVRADQALARAARHGRDLARDARGQAGPGGVGWLTPADRLRPPCPCSPARDRARAAS